MAPSIAWIEDDINIIYPVIEPLKKEGYNIIEFSEIPKDEDTIRSLKNVDLILLDMIMLPDDEGTDTHVKFAGLEFLNRLRKQYKIEVPAIILSVVPKIENITNDLNVLDILTKPVSSIRLRDRIKQALEKV